MKLEKLFSNIRTFLLWILYRNSTRYFILKYMKSSRPKPVITLGSDSYPQYNYLNEDGVPTGIDVELATEAFKRMGDEHWC